MWPVAANETDADRIRKGSCDFKGQTAIGAVGNVLSMEGVFGGDASDGISVDKIWKEDSSKLKVSSIVRK